ncbi:aldo/keto reductase [Variovorax sp. J22P240]|uniref:aldo/keto reductase n=1 Tax=unclassified Variovorax TaxID=663243 RepID=UPI0025767CF6|nr:MULTISPECIES: aldo/keto reductase [unclassified Variovorax]MDL9997374.1 aldo/keto reductase [Variovorax sp. J22P240]MDM0048030.1 aldo/keto reductase [Variovorax sp. J22R115]
MQFRPLGRSGLQVSPLAFGGNVFGWTVDETLSFRLLDAWVDAGFNFVDTADVYSSWVPGHSGGESETIIGKWLRQTGKRHRIVLATKVGKPMGEGKKGLSPAYIREAVDASLRRLKTDHIDLYQSHDDDPETPFSDTAEAFAALIKAGKVRAIGASNFSAPRLAEALDVAEKQGLPRYESLQPLYNLYDRDVFEKELEPLCVERGIGVINFYALAAGFLTGKYRTEADAAKSARGVNTTKKYLNPRGLRVLDALDAAAHAYGATQGQVAIAWQIARPSITAPIASATSMKQLDELIAAASLQLAPETIAALDAASAETAAQR